MNRGSLDWKGGFVSRGEHRQRAVKSLGRSWRAVGTPTPRALEEGTREVRVQGTDPNSKKQGMAPQALGTRGDCLPPLASLGPGCHGSREDEEGMAV